jgi:hypothetical protein
MPKLTGIFFDVDEGWGGGPIASSIERSLGFTDVFDRETWRGFSTAVALVSTHERRIGYVGLVRRSGPVATGKVRVRVSDLSPIDEPIAIGEIMERLPARSREYFEEAIDSGTPMTPGTWRQVSGVLRGLRPELVSVMDRLERRAIPPRIRADGEIVVAQERDAVNLALRASGFDADLLIKLNPDADGTAPFLSGLWAGRITEDQAIAHDAGIFGRGWRLIARHQVGSASFERDGAKLTVMNVNRTRVENTLGVDLLYYLHPYRSYVLVQYKSMDPEGDEEGFRPVGASYRAELERMRLFMRDHPLPEAAELMSYRLHPGLFYFKLCGRTVLNPLATKMIGGMYLPLDYWELLLGAPETRGPRGGLMINYGTAGRYLTNTQFVELLQAGWIGSRLEHTDAVTALVQAAIASDRSVIVAALTPA